MLSDSALRIFQYLVNHINSGVIRIGKPETYISYSDIHNKLRLEQQGRTIGDSLNNQGMGELAQWVKDENLPAITGLIVSKFGESERRYLPGKGYFKMYNRPDYDFGWWQDEIKKATQTDWSAILELHSLQTTYPDEITQDTYPEGARKQVTVNAYERNTRAREKCIEHWGVNCQGCGINFESVYGPIGKMFIHVHHLKPISEIGENYEVDPIKDLIPLCPNCHSMVHRTKTPMTATDIKMKLLIQKKINEILKE
ncbi:MAG: HNH endonuclease [Methylotenera sp.]